MQWWYRDFPCDLQYPAFSDVVCLLNTMCAPEYVLREFCICVSCFHEMDRMLLTFALPIEPETRQCSSALEIQRTFKLLIKQEPLNAFTGSTNIAALHAYILCLQLSLQKSSVSMNSSMPHKFKHNGNSPGSCSHT